MALSTDQYGYLIDPLVPITDEKGTTIKDGFLRVYVAGSSTPVITYRNYDGAANEQTIELDNSGRCKYPVIVSKSLAYKVVVYDAQHSQETPVITVDKMFAIGASVTAGAGSTIVQGLDDVEGESDGFVTAEVVGTTAKVKLDATNVSHTLTSDAAVGYAANAGYMVPALSNDSEDPGDPQKLPLAWIYGNRLNAVHTKTEISDFADDNDGFLVDSNAGPKFMKWKTLANKVLGFIKSLSTTITAFRTGDVIPVDGPSGTAKMSKDDLLRETAENALAGNLATNFSISTSYVSRDAVIYEGKLYVFTSDHPAGAWIGTDAQHINETYITSRLASRTSIANTFSDSTAYSAGDFVTHKGQFYRFKVDHAAGAFDASEMQYQNVPLFADYYSKNTDLQVKYGMLFNFEEGDCNISNSGWWPFDDDKHRVRIKKGMNPYLKAGYKITLSSFVGKENKPLRFFLGVQKNDGTYYTPGSWYTSEYTCEYNGFYTILLAYVGDLLPTCPSVDDLSEKLVIKDSNGVILTPNYRIEVNTKKFDEETTYSNMLFEVGNIDYETWIYQTSTKRIRLKKESILHLCPGDKIYLTDYTDAAFYVGWHDMSGTADRQGWNTSEFVVTDEGYYSILVRRKDGLDIVNKDWLLSLVRVEHNGILYQGKDAVQRQLDIVGVNAWQDSPFADIRSIAHRGLSDDFPENTLISFRAARKAGFTYVETDIRRTSDGHWVCIHDATVDRTSDGTGNVEDMTLAQLKALDFGSWKDAKFAGEKIPTLEEFMSCCKALNLRPYLELKGGVSSRALMEDIVGIIRSYGMDDKVTIIGFATYGQWLYRDHVWDEARLGAIVNSVDTTDPYYSIMVGWRADGHDVFYDSAATPDATTLTQLKSDKLPLERWSVYSASNVININSYVSGITSNFLIASKILYENEINKSSLR